MVCVGVRGGGGGGVFFFNDTATTEIYTLSLHDALPICMISILDSLLMPENISFSYSFAALIAEECSIIRFMKKFCILYRIFKNNPDWSKNG